MSQHSKHLPTGHSVVLWLVNIIGVLGLGTATWLFEDIFRSEGYRGTVVAQTDVGEQSRPIIEFNTPTGTRRAVAARIKEENKHFDTGSRVPIRQWPDRSQVQIATLTELWIWPALLAAFSAFFLFIGLATPLAAGRRAKRWQSLPERGQRSDAQIIAIEEGRDHLGRRQWRFTLEIKQADGSVREVNSPTLTMKNKPPVNVGDSLGLIHESDHPDYNMIDPELLARWQDKV